MADREASDSGATDAEAGSDANAFDRVGKPRPRAQRRNPAGKEALFSTSPTSGPPSTVEVHCRVCNVTTGISAVADWWLLVRPPFLVNPFTHQVFNKCANCGTRTWLDVDVGATLRSLLGRQRT